MSTTATRITASDLWRSRDKYGRSTWQHYGIRGVVVALRTWSRESLGYTAFVNLWDGSEVRTFQSIAAAKQFLVENGAAR